MADQPITPFRDTTELRQEVIDTCFYMRDVLGYFVGTWGNIGVRLETGLLVEHLKQLKAGQPVEIPIYDFTTDPLNF